MMAISRSETALQPKPIERIPHAKRKSRKVYFILCELTGRLKCGVANDPAKRLLSMQTASPTVLRLIASTDGGVELERSVHTKLTRWRVHGEWFHYVSAVRDVIIDELVAHLFDGAARHKAREMWESRLPQPKHPP